MIYATATDQFLNESREIALLRLEAGEILSSEELYNLRKIEAEMAFRGLALRPQVPNAALYARAKERLEALHSSRSSAPSEYIK